MSRFEKVTVSWRYQGDPLPRQTVYYRAQTSATAADVYRWYRESAPSGLREQVSEYASATGAGRAVFLWMDRESVDDLPERDV